MRSAILIFCSMIAMSRVTQAFQCGNKTGDLKKDLQSQQFIFKGTVKKDGEGKKLVVERTYKGHVPPVLTLKDSTDELSRNPLFFEVGESYLIGSNVKALIEKGELPLAMCDTYQRTKEIPEVIKSLEAGTLKNSKSRTESKNLKP